MISTQLRLAARNAFRRRTRTLLTMGMVTGGVGLLLLLTTWITGATGGMLAAATSRGGHVRVVDADFARREQLAPLDEHIPAASQLAAQLATTSGVVAVEPRTTVGVVVTAGDEIGEVFGRVIGASDTYFRRIGAPDKLVAGRWFSGQPGELVAGTTLVEEAGAKVGDELLLLGVTQDGSMSPIKGQLVGVIAGDSELNQIVLAPHERIQWMADIDDGATEVLIYGEDWRSAADLAARVRSSPAVAGHTVESWDERDPWRSLVVMIQAIRSAIILVVVLLVALGIWNTMMMSVLERTHEIGVLRALGMTRPGVVALFVGEAASIGLVGAVAGVVVGAVPSWLLERSGVHIGAKAAASSNLAVAERIYGDLTFDGVLLAFVLGVTMAALGSLIPAVRASSIQPVTAMRTGR